MFSIKIKTKKNKNVSVFLNKSGSEPHTLKIKWTPMEKREWNAPGLRYLIKYRIWPENKDSHHNDEWNEFFIEDPFMVICVLYFSNVGCSLKKFQHNTNEILFSTRP